IALRADPDRAVSLLRTAHELARTKPEYRSACALALAETLLERGETDAAAALFAEELAAVPGTERAEFGLGMVALARGEVPHAEARFTKARQHPSCRRQATAHLARLARTRGDTDAARQFEAEAGALDTDPPWPDPFLDKVVNLLVGARGLARRADLLVRDGRFREAAELYAQQVEQPGTSAGSRCRALASAAVNLLRAGDLDRAIARAREAVRVDDSDPRARYTLALALFNKAEPLWVADPASRQAALLFREAAGEARKAVELKPDHAQAHLFWGLSLKNLGDPKGALEPLQKGLALSPGEFEMCLALGQVLAATGDRAGAERQFRVAGKIEPRDPRPARELAKLK
ncbi:MAG TPA: tetratricopeptide repeat protein, partial [Gemmata sp.]